jgi:ABC-type antimicrobial peptide transport system permease subunit
VLASTVEQRTQELGIRMALGAREGDVLRLVITSGLKLVLIGMALGLAVGFALTRWLSTLLFGVSPANPLVYLAVAVGMILIALVACYLPARTAVKVDPMLALRAE